MDSRPADLRGFSGRYYFSIGNSYGENKDNEVASSLYTSVHLAPATVVLLPGCYPLRAKRLRFFALRVVAGLVAFVTFRMPRVQKAAVAVDPFEMGGSLTCAVVAQDTGGACFRYVLDSLKFVRSALRIQHLSELQNLVTPFLHARCGENAGSLVGPSSLSGLNVSFPHSFAS